MALDDERGRLAPTRSAVGYGTAQNDASPRTYYEQHVPSRADDGTGRTITVWATAVGLTLLAAAAMWVGAPAAAAPAATVDAEDPRRLRPAGFISMK